MRLTAGPRIRIVSWGLLGVLAFVDANVASNISLGLLYFIPLSLAALLLSLPETLSFAAVCAAARILFGPLKDPLGLREIALRFSPEDEYFINVIISCLAYAGLGVLLHALGQQQRRLATLDRELEKDPLTGLANRRALDRFLQEQYGRQLSVLAADLDFFKRVNDAHGHGLGDQVLKELARRLVAATRGGDLIARTGGEEFVVLLPQIDVALAKVVAERICHRVRSEPFRIDDLSISITISVGIASGPTSDALLKEADRALYRAKQLGRNRVEVETH